MRNLADLYLFQEALSWRVNCVHVGRRNKNMRLYTFLGIGTVARQR